jgi:hypothetical protein
MPAIGKVTQKTVNGNRILTDETGQTWTLPGPSDPSLRLDIDPRIDLTKPIYEQVLKLAARDKAAAGRAKSRKRKAAIA